MRKRITQLLKKHDKPLKILFVTVLIFVASFFRLYRIEDLTEFLGDQGRDGIVIRQLERTRTLPDVGPSLSNGRFTGPFYYYLIAPSFILSQYNPAIPAIQMAVMGIISIVILFVLSTSIYGFTVGYGISILYALSPLMVFQDRRLWNPTPIPFFTLLVFLSVYLIRKQKYWALIVLFLSDAILFQLHYVNSITIILSIVFVCFEFYNSVKINMYKKYLIWIGAAFLISVLFSYPFISYETGIKFRDIIGSVGTVSYTGGFLFSKRHYLENIMLITTDLMKYVLVIPWKIPLFIVSLPVIILNFLRREYWSYMYFGWFGLAVFLMAFYKDTINVQYLYQLIPITFLLFGGALEYIAARYSRGIMIGLVAVLGTVMIFQTDVFGVGHNDIVKTQKLTDTVIKLSTGMPFAFTTVSSRSFSDLHYRFFMDKRDISPVNIDSKEYNLLFLICDTVRCPSMDDLYIQNKIYAVCSEIVCSFDNPIIDMSKWQGNDLVNVGASVVYEFVRKPD